MPGLFYGAIFRSDGTIVSQCTLLDGNASEVAADCLQVRVRARSAPLHLALPANVSAPPVDAFGCSVQTTTFVLRSMSRQRPASQSPPAGTRAHAPCGAHTRHAAGHSAPGRCTRKAAACAAHPGRQPLHAALDECHSVASSLQCALCAGPTFSSAGPATT